MMRKEIWCFEQGWSIGLLVNSSSRTMKTINKRKPKYKPVATSAGSSKTRSASNKHKRTKIIKMHNDIMIHLVS